MISVSTWLSGGSTKLDGSPPSISRSRASRISFSARSLLVVINSLSRQGTHLSAICPQSCGNPDGTQAISKRFGSVSISGIRAFVVEVDTEDIRPQAASAFAFAFAFASLANALALGSSSCSVRQSKRLLLSWDCSSWFCPCRRTRQSSVALTSFTLISLDVCSYLL